MPHSVKMYLRTTGLQFDDRVRKQSASLVALGAKVTVNALETLNVPSTGTTEDGAAYRTFNIRSRSLFDQRRGLALKLAELHARFLADLVTEPADVVWIHNYELGPLLLPAYLLRRAGRIRKLVWDQHELPPEAFLNRPYLLPFVARAIALCDAIVVASRERRDLLHQKVGAPLSNFVVLENLPDFAFATNTNQPLPPAVVDWLNGDRYFLAQAGAAPLRNFASVVAAAVHGGFRIIVPGPTVATQVQELRARWGASFDDHIYLCGMVPQMRLVDFIDNAIASIVLYENADSNHWLCAPNRLFQALVRGTPVVVGANPPMRRVVRDHGIGIALESDGSDVGELTRALHTAIGAEKIWRESAAGLRQQYDWNSQNRLLANLLDF